jgi:hypothetical protein
MAHFFFLIGEIGTLTLDWSRLGQIKHLTRKASIGVSEFFLSFSFCAKLEIGLCFDHWLVVAINCLHHYAGERASERIVLYFPPGLDGLN